MTPFPIAPDWKAILEEHLEASGGLPLKPIVIDIMSLAENCFCMKTTEAKKYTIEQKRFHDPENGRMFIALDCPYQQGAHYYH